MATDKVKKIFKDVKYFLVEENDSLKQILKEGGAHREYYVTQLVNFVISDTCNFPQYDQAVDFKIPIVTTNWIHMSIKCETLLPYRPFSKIKDGLFSTIVACPSQIPTVERDPLLAMIIYYGGRYKTNLNASCTHLIVGKPVGRKYEFASKFQPQIKIVTSEWVVDSISANRLLPEAEYEPVSGGSPQRSPLKPFSPSGNVQMTPEIMNSTASTFMTPVTPNNNELPKGDKKMLSENKENNGIGGSDVSGTADLLKGFVILFSGYEERLPPDTFAIWEEVIKKSSGIIRESYTSDVTHLICLHQQSALFKKALQDRKKIATAYWLNDILVAKKYFPPRTPLHLPVPFTDTIPGMKNSLMTVSGYDGRERVLIKHMINFLGAQYTGHMARAHTQVICKAPSGEKYKKAIEWGIPVTSPKWLGDMIQTGQAFPCKGKSKYAVLNTPDELGLNPTFSTHITDIWNEDFSGEQLLTSGKRKLSEIQDGESNELQPTEKQRKLNFPPHVKRVLFTGLTGATVHRLRQNVLKLKGELAKGVNDCTHLVAPKITRTVKFLSAVSICKFLVAPAWVDESFEARNFLEETNYTLVDPESEDLFGFKLTRSLQRAQTRQVCKGLHFHVTPSILPAPNAMKEIIECAGGKMTEVKTVEDIKNIFLVNVLKDQTYNSYLVSCMDDKKLWNDVVKEGYDVYNVELILSGVMKQELEWNLHHL
ncbi:PAX-interacting protein 1-like isoform X2 [Hydractinia symbiolongicarpus]|uniref:PAX-interacting protein 1-like isoform X2 n=1 Tax=Hydractinia symbiolongicarpus TaxID=13093 RepID=UPI00254E7AF3|nr:PAX-interacting protein 1-like isoform X2 [Hydractinia symbiolongicarpus]